MAVVIQMQQASLLSCNMSQKTSSTKYLGSWWMNFSLSPLFLSSPFFFPFSLSFSLVPFLPLFEFLALFLVGIWQFSHVYSQFWQFSPYISPLSFFYLTQNFCLQPTQGLLGTNFKSSGIYELIREGNTFPDGYFLQCEIVSIFYSQHMYSCYLILPL